MIKMHIIFKFLSFVFAKMLMFISGRFLIYPQIPRLRFIVMYTNRASRLIVNTNNQLIAHFTMTVNSASLTINRLVVET